MTIPAVKARLDRMRTELPLIKDHSERAANAIAIYLHVAEGLKSHVSDDQIPTLAATLTAGILAESKRPPL